MEFIELPHIKHDCFSAGVNYLRETREILSLNENSRCMGYTVKSC